MRAARHAAGYCARMSLISFTLQVYQESFVEAGKGFGRTLWAVAVLVASWVVLFIASIALSPFGLPGGFVMFAIQCVCTGTYLSMVEVGVLGQRVLKPGDLRDHLAQHWQIVAAVAFVFWLPTLILGFSLPGPTFTLAAALASVVFNPVPEMVYQERHEGGLDILRDAVGFMQRNWPEWMVALALVLLPWLGVWSLLLGGSSLDLVTQALTTFGPFFGFVEGGAGVVVVASTAGISLLLAPIAHFVMLFRGQLYKRLRNSNRRQRAWQSKF